MVQSGKGGRIPLEGVNHRGVDVVSVDEVFLDKECDDRKHGFGDCSPGLLLEERGPCTNPIPN